MFNIGYVYVCVCVCVEGDEGGRMGCVRGAEPHCSQYCFAVKNCTLPLCVDEHRIYFAIHSVD